MKKTGKILFITPDLDGQGGVSSFGKYLKPYFSEQVLYFERKGNSWPLDKKNTKKIIDQLSNSITYLFAISFNKITHVHINLSFSKKSLIREVYYIVIAKLLRKKVTLFFHGWNNDDYSKIKKNYSFIFNKIFNMSSLCFVLAKSFKKDLRCLGYKNNIVLGRTYFNSDLVKNLTQEYLIRKYGKLDSINFLFLSRIESSKGIFELVKAFELFKNNKENYFLTIAGSGGEENTIAEYIKYRKLNNIELIGYVTGKKKQLIMKRSHIFILPSYREGMPISLIESMAVGLPIVTTLVGGIKDFFVDGEMGTVIKSVDANNIYQAILKMSANLENLKKMSLNNYLFAKKNFEAKLVAEKIEKTVISL